MKVISKCRYLHYICNLTNDNLINKSYIKLPGEKALMRQDFIAINYVLIIHAIYSITENDS